MSDSDQISTVVIPPKVKTIPSTVSGNFRGKTFYIYMYILLQKDDRHSY